MNESGAFVPVEYVDLADRYMDAEPAARYDIVREIRSGDRCPHGYPDQGEGCEVCNARPDFRNHDERRRDDA